MPGNPKTVNSHKEHRELIDGVGFFVIFVLFVANGCL